MPSHTVHHGPEGPNQRTRVHHQMPPEGQAANAQVTHGVEGMTVQRQDATKTRVQHHSAPHGVQAPDGSQMFGDAMKTRVQHGVSAPPGAAQAQQPIVSGQMGNGAPQVTQGAAPVMLGAGTQVQIPKGQLPPLSPEEVLAQLRQREGELRAQIKDAESELSSVLSAIKYAEKKQAEAPSSPATGEESSIEAEKLAELSIPQALPVIFASHDPAELTAWAEAEEGGKNRKGIVEAIDSRLAELEEAESDADDDADSADDDDSGADSEDSEP